MPSLKKIDIKTLSWKQVVKSDLFRIAVIVIIWRIALLALFLFSSVKLPLSPTVHIAPNVPGPLFLQSTIRWDAFYYLDIILKGYSGSPTQPYVAFFPLFPLLVSLFHKIGVNILLASVFINTLATFAASYFLLLLANSYFKNKKLAYRTVLIFLFSPVAYFLAAFYTEAIFCAFFFGAIWYARQGRWLLASILAALTTATRLPGVLVLIVLFIEYMEQHQFNVKKFNWDVLFLLIAPAGLASYMLFLKVKTGDALAFMHVTKLYWSYHKLTPNIIGTVYDQVLALKDIIWRHRFNEIVTLIDSGIPFMAWFIGLFTTVWMFIKRLPLSYRLLGIASLILFSINGNFVSDNRYFVLLFPIYIMTVEFIKNETAYSLFLALSASSMAVLLTAFANNYWTG